VAHIRIINPNTTVAFSTACLAAGRAVAASGTQVSAAQPARGTPSVECHVDEAIATLGVIDAIRSGEQADVDGFVIACFGDTGLEAAREVTAAPVVGMTEAALYTAAMIAPVFSIVTLPRRTRIFAQRSVWHAGLEQRCVSVRAIDVAVLDCEDEAEVVYEPFVLEARRAIVEDHAEAILLGCAGLQPLLARLQTTLGVPVIEGVAAAVKMVECLLALGLKTSKLGAWGYPLHKARDLP
jgi:allantoin racemase